MEWREITGWPYEVSDYGHVRRSKPPHSAGGYTAVGRELKAAILAGGYEQVTLCNGPGRRENFMVHRLVAHAFLGPQPEGLIVCHKDGNPANNQVGNLYWGTYANNTADALLHGTKQTGEESPNAVLTEGAVRHIRRRELPQSSYAALYGVSKTAVRLAQQGKTWRHIDD